MIPSLPLSFRFVCAFTSYMLFHYRDDFNDVTPPTSSRDRKEVYASNDDVTNAFFARSNVQHGDARLRSVDTDSSMTDVSQSASERVDSKPNDVDDDVDFLAAPHHPFNEPKSASDELLANTNARYHA